jgi:catechol 2,3-dioxygenase-like lactoylglutathione lyase family enzyme
MSAKVKGLGHIGFYVHDLDLMKDFYANFMGMTLTKVGPLGAFFKCRPGGLRSRDCADQRPSLT